MMTKQKQGKKKAVETNPVRELRSRLGLSRETLAEELGCTPRAVCFWENNRRLPYQLALLRNFEALAASEAA